MGLHSAGIKWVSVRYINLFGCTMRGRGGEKQNDRKRESHEFSRVISTTA